ncbi:acyl-CoA dehydrogenase family protein [Streptomyces sp. WMMC897]|uniref:acyl-CoA dehydrogenase family protein n=1 Tax=Streptomyces sp. WMMC897 TaxID=3014782 RepID=UPI0022B665C7|nr:acyl-CoA dehydrogenase family protein [Streptomyces sp. WMMC897]MCZ7415760.1 acyl-CoA dehydrogenase family protein [Streptomyces sp. WMMC897]
MDRHFTDRRHQELRRQVRDFAEAEVRPRVAAMEAGRRVCPELSRLIARQGWIGVTVPRGYGGMGDGHVAKTVVIEELSRVSGAMGAMAQASQLGVAKILHFGSERQKRAWLPAVTAGECLPTIAVTEPGSGGHVLGMTGSAVRDGEDYVLNGSKVFVGNSHIGDLHGVVLRTGPGSQGLSAFLVEAGTPGCTLAPQQPAMGLHGFSFGEVRLIDCRVPASALLGSEGDGLAVAYSSSVLYGRANLTAVALGIHTALLEETSRLCAARTRYGAPLGRVGAVRAKLGRMQSRLMTARLAAYQAVHLLDQGQPCDAELMNAKLVNVENALDSARDAMELHAASGLFTDCPVERYLRDVHHLFAPAGTSDVQRLRLGDVALGTSRGDWSARLADLVRRETAATAESAATAPAPGGAPPAAAHVGRTGAADAGPADAPDAPGAPDPVGAGRR